jgi:hypothetical protein
MNSQLEHLQSKCVPHRFPKSIFVSYQFLFVSYTPRRYVGTGHADITKWEWAVNIHRDSLAAHIGNPGMLMYSISSLTFALFIRTDLFHSQVLVDCHGRVDGPNKVQSIDGQQLCILFHQ